MDTETYAPDRHYRMPGKSAHPDATPANTHDSVDGIPSGKLLNVRRKANHEIGESYPDAHYAEQPAGMFSTEEPDAAIIAHPYQLTDCQFVIANTVVPGKNLHNQSKTEQRPTEPTHEPSSASCPDGMPQ